MGFLILFGTYHLIMFYPFKNFNPVCLQNSLVSSEIQPTFNLWIWPWTWVCKPMFCVKHSFSLSFIFLQSLRKFELVLFPTITETWLDILPQIVTLTLGMETEILYVTNLLMMLYPSVTFDDIHLETFQSYWRNQFSSLTSSGNLDLVHGTFSSCFFFL